MKMPDLSKEELTEVIKDAVQAAHGVSENHKDDHEFIQLLKRKEERKEARVEKFKLSAIGTLGVMVVTGLMWIGRFIVEHWDKQ